MGLYPTRHGRQNSLEIRPRESPRNYSFSGHNFDRSRASGRGCIRDAFPPLTLLSISTRVGRKHVIERARFDADGNRHTHAGLSSHFR